MTASVGLACQVVRDVRGRQTALVLLIATIAQVVARYP